MCIDTGYHWTDLYQKQVVTTPFQVIAPRMFNSAFAFHTPHHTTMYLPTEPISMCPIVISMLMHTQCIVNLHAHVVNLFLYHPQQRCRAFTFC